MMIRQQIFGALLALLVLSAAGASQAAPLAGGDDLLRKCLAADGTASYQNTPCPPDQSIAWEREIDRREPLSPAQLREQQARLQAANTPAPRAAAAPRTVRAAPPTRRPAADPCAAAREKRRKTLDEVGLARTFDLLRRLDDEVARACRRRY
jgi:hypothetical protein